MDCTGSQGLKSSQWGCRWLYSGGDSHAGTIGHGRTLLVSSAQTERQRGMQLVNKAVNDRCLCDGTFYKQLSCMRLSRYIYTPRAFIVRMRAPSCTLAGCGLGRSSALLWPCCCRLLIADITRSTARVCGFAQFTDFSSIDACGSSLLDRLAYIGALYFAWKECGDGRLEVPGVLRPLNRHHR